MIGCDITKTNNLVDNKMPGVSSHQVNTKLDKSICNLKFDTSGKEGGRFHDGRDSQVEESSLICQGHHLVTLLGSLLL